MQNQKTKALVQGAVIAAMYAALTYAASAANLAYGNVHAEKDGQVLLYGENSRGRAFEASAELVQREQG